MTADFKYRAFISYSHRDKKWADWLHRALETYRVPKALIGKVGRDGPTPAKLFPVYRDRAETPAVADLQEYVQAALAQSAYLIVICSPNSRRSRWVDQEILRFKRLGRETRIFALIVEGEPNDSDRAGDASALECFPNALRFRLGPDGELSSVRIEPAAADARSEGDGKENAKLKIIAGLLGADLDDLKRRDLENSRRRTRLYGAIAAGMAVLAIVAAGAGVLAYVYALRSQEATKVATVQARTAERTTDFLVSLFTVANPEANSGDKMTARQMLDRGVQEVNSKLAAEDTVRGYLLRAMGQAYGGLGLYSKAVSLLQAAVNAAHKTGNADDILQANLALAANLYANSDYEASRRLFESSLRDAKSQHGALHSSIAEALTGLGDSEAALGDNDAADAHLRSALAMNIQLHGERSAETAITLNSLGMVQFQQHRLADAELSFNRSLGIRRSLFGLHSAGVAASLNNLGAVQYQRGDYRGAEATYEDALPIYRVVYGSEHPQVGVLLNNIGRSQLMANQLAEAETTLTQALAMDRRFLPKDDDQLVPPLNSLGMIALARRDGKNAQALLEESRDIALKKNSAILDQVLGNCSAMYMQLGRPDDARSALERARSFQHTQYGASLQNTEAWRAAVLDLTEAYNDHLSHDNGAALKLLRSATPILTARFGAGGFYTRQAAALTNLIAPRGPK